MSPRNKSNEQEQQDNVREDEQVANPAEAQAAEAEAEAVEAAASADEQEPGEAPAEGETTEGEQPEEEKPKSYAAMVAERAAEVFTRNYEKGRVTEDQAQAVIDFVEGHEEIESADALFSAEAEALEQYGANEVKRTALPEGDRKQLSTMGKEINRSHLWGRKIVSIVLAMQQVEQPSEETEEESVEETVSA